MADPTSSNPITTRLVIVLTGLSVDSPESAATPFRYAATAAAMGG